MMTMQRLSYVCPIDLEILQWWQSNVWAMCVCANLSKWCYNTIKCDIYTEQTLKSLSSVFGYRLDKILFLTFSFVLQGNSIWLTTNVIRDVDPSKPDHHRCSSNVIHCIGGVTGQCINQSCQRDLDCEASRCHCCRR